VEPCAVLRLLALLLAAGLAVGIRLFACWVDGLAAAVRFSLRLDDGLVDDGGVGGLWR
jgi:hypothetical protein